MLATAILVPRDVRRLDAGWALVEIANAALRITRAWTHEPRADMRAIRYQAALSSSIAIPSAMC